MITSSYDLPIRVARLLARAVEESGKSQSEIARLAGLKRDSLRRTLNGDRAVTLDEALMVLGASDLEAEETLLLLLLVGEEFALTQSGTPHAKFLGELCRRAPVEIVEQLGDSVEELRPRWANGTAKMLARTLTQHIADLNRRGDAIGERLLPLVAGS